MPGFDSANGTISNPTSVSHTYRLEVSWMTASGVPVITAKPIDIMIRTGHWRHHTATDEVALGPGESAELVATSSELKLESIQIPLWTDVRATAEQVS